MQNLNRTFQREFAKSNGYTMQEAGWHIAERAKRVAELARIQFGGMDSKGVMFYTSKSYNIPDGIGTLDRAVRLPFEIVIDEPSQVLIWAKQAKVDLGKIRKW